MLNILINAYAIAPGWGSEQGVGWHWMTSIAEHCHVHVITEGEWREEITEAIERLPHKDNISMYYLPVSDKVRRMCWNQGDYRFYFYYALWQRRALRLAREIVARESIDVIHQLNMVGFREPGLLWKIKGIPYVWGPFAGSSRIDLEYFRDEPLAVRAKYRFKNIVNWLQFRYSHKVTSALRHADVAITPIEEIAVQVRERYDAEVMVLPASGLRSGCVDMSLRQRQDDCLNILWIGRLISSKKLDIALQTMADLPGRINARLHIVGYGLNGEEQEYKAMAERLGVADRCVWHGKVENSKAKEMMLGMDLMLFTSVYEGSPAVVPEAIQARLPIVCHDCCGFGPLVDDSIGRKIELSTPRKSAQAFAHIITHFADHREELEAMAPAFDAKAEPLIYESIAKTVVETYNSLA